MSRSSRSRPRTVNRLLDSSGMAVWLLDAQGRLIYISASMAEWLGRSPEDCLGTHCFQPSTGAGDRRVSESGAGATSSSGGTVSELGGLAPTLIPAAAGSAASADLTPSSDWVAALSPAPGLRARRHQTRRVTVAHPGGVREGVAHFVLLTAGRQLGDADSEQDVSDSERNRALPESDIGGSVPTRTSRHPDCLVLGCLGDFLSDAELPLRDWHGQEGLREAARVQECLDRHRARQGQLVTWATLGESPAADRLRRRVELAASVRCHVGVFGPDGGDATSLAWHIHRQSAPGEPALLLDGSLMDVELLQAYGEPLLRPLRENRESTGTLVVEQLQDLRPDAQQQLLTWLRQWPDRLRLIGCIHQQVVMPQQETPEAELARRTGVPLPEAGLDGALWDTMTTLPVLIPPLQSRLADIAELAAAMIRDASRRLAAGPERAKRDRKGTGTQGGRTQDVGFRDAPRLTEEATDLLQRYPWPGNLKELADAMWHAVSAAEDDLVRPEHLPLAIRSFRPTRVTTSGRKKSPALPGAGAPAEPTDFRIDSLDNAVSAYEQELIGKAMNASGGNKAEAARRLGISRARLLRKLSDAADRAANGTTPTNPGTTNSRTNPGTQQ